MSDISGLVSSTGVALEAQAFQTFGAIVANQTNNVLGGIFGSNTGSTINQNVNPLPPDKILRHGDWNVTPYAAATAAGMGGYDPKTKFLFKVHFSFNRGVAEQAASLGLDVEHSLNRDLTYVVKQIDLPKYTFDYEEINMYNFRTKLLKRITHEPLNFVFYDDVANNAIKFMNVYLQLLQPIARREWEAGANLEDYGFAFLRQLGGADSAMRAVLQNPLAKDILRSLTIEQYYLNRSQPHLQGSQIRQAVYVNTFTFTNPRIMTFVLHDQDHEQGNAPNTLECQFDFDALHMKTGLIGDSIEKTTDGLMATYDILTGEGRSGGQFLNGPTTPAGGGGNFLSPFTQIIANQGGRAVREKIANTIHKSGLGNVAGGALANATSGISGTLGTHASKTLQNLGNGIADGIIPPKAPVITDNSVGGETISQTATSDDAG